MATAVNAAETQTTNPALKTPPTKEQLHRAHLAREAAFEQKLGLTDAQKIQARELRRKGHTQMEPLMKKLKAKKHEESVLRLMKLSQTAQEEKLQAVEKEIQELETQLGEIRKQNMKDFESILTRKQLRTLKKMKKEGRKKFEQNKKGFYQQHTFKK